MSNLKLDFDNSCLELTSEKKLNPMFEDTKYEWNHKIKTPSYDITSSEKQTY